LSWGAGCAHALDALAGRLDSDRAELMRLAARQLLANPRDLDQAVTEEIYGGDANRDLLIARNTRRQQTADQATATPAVRKAPSPQGNPFGRRHVFRFDEDTKRRLEELADEYGPRLAVRAAAGWASQTHREPGGR